MRQRLAQVGQGLAKSESRRRVGCAWIVRGAHLDHTYPGALSQRARRALAEREQYGVCGDGRMADEGRLLACVEKADPEVVIRARRRQDEGGFRVRIFASDRLEHRITLFGGIQNDRGGVAAEARLGEGIDLKNPHARFLHAFDHPATLQRLQRLNGQRRTQWRG